MNFELPDRLVPRQLKAVATWLSAAVTATVPMLAWAPVYQRATRSWTCSMFAIRDMTLSAWQLLIAVLTLFLTIIGFVSSASESRTARKRQDESIALQRWEAELKWRERCEMQVRFSRSDPVQWSLSDAAYLICCFWCNIHSSLDHLIQIAASSFMSSSCLLEASKPRSSHKIQLSTT